MKVFNGIPKLEEAVGTHLGFSGWNTVTQLQIDTFAQSTGDYQRSHVDSEMAANGTFGATIAHGYLTLSLAPSLVTQLYTVEKVRMRVNYGTNKIRFPAPVPVDSKIRAAVELRSVTSVCRVPSSRSHYH
jgi:acyl dehydratase